MRRWKLPAAATSAEALVLEEVPTPEPGPGEVRIRVRALSINARDQMIVGEGPFGRLPGRDLVPLSDVAGEVDAVGADVESLTIGDRVTNLHFLGWEDGAAPDGLGLGVGALEEDGMLSEWVVLPAARVTRAPSHFDHAEAATLPVAGVTAWNALFADHPVSSGDTVLTIGSGGVSLFALQLARAVGATVYVGVQRDTKGGELVALGAQAILSTAEPGWGDQALTLSGGVTKVVNTVGASILDDALTTLATGGEVALLGLRDLEPVAVDVIPMLAKSAVLRGISVGSNRMHRDLVAFLEKHDTHPVVHRCFAFDEAPAAFVAQADRDILGKIVIEL